jgi:hypothetical protein
MDYLFQYRLSVNFLLRNRLQCSFNVTSKGLVTVRTAQGGHARQAAIGQSQTFARQAAIGQSQTFRAGQKIHPPFFLWPHFSPPDFKLPAATLIGSGNTKIQSGIVPHPSSP